MIEDGDGDGDGELMMVMNLNIAIVFLSGGGLGATKLEGLWEGVAANGCDCGGGLTEFFFFLFFPKFFYFYYNYLFHLLFTFKFFLKAR